MEFGFENCVGTLYYLLTDHVRKSEEKYYFLTRPPFIFLRCQPWWTTFSFQEKMLTHYDADETIAVPELTKNSFYILFPAKGIMNYRQIISSRLYVRINQF